MTHFRLHSLRLNGVPAPAASPLRIPLVDSLRRAAMCHRGEPWMAPVIEAMERDRRHGISIKMDTQEKQPCTIKP
jgi:hypothetical protein